MEKIRNYLETMFLSLPNTLEVQRAKSELLAMMEDKYQALLAEGLPEEEAVERVIGEFGSLEELAEDLGIGDVVANAGNIPQGRRLAYEECFYFLDTAARCGLQRALGIALCIAASACPVISSSLQAGKSDRGALAALGLASFFICVGCGVFFIIFSSLAMKKWRFLKKTPCVIDYQTLSDINQKYESDESGIRFLMAGGVAMCIFSVIPVSVCGAIWDNDLLSGLMAGVLLLMVAFGVFLICFSSFSKHSYQLLLNLNKRGTVGANYFDSQKMTPHFEGTLGSIMGVYWQTVTCLYFIWSFLTFQWWKTWVIWPLAGIIHKLLVNLYGHNDQNHRDFQRQNPYL